MLIATGTKPAASTKVPINGKSIINSDLILEMVNLPKTMIVVGGGVIGVEYTCMFSALGVRVTLIERRPRLLEFADQEIVEALSYHLRDSRVTMRLNEEVESVTENPDGTVVANLESKKKSSGRCVALRGRPPGQRGRAQPRQRRHRSRLPRAHSRRQGLHHQASPASTPSATSSVFRRSRRFRWSRAVSHPRAPLAMRPCCRTRASTPTASGRFPKSPFSARPKSS